MNLRRMLVAPLAWGSLMAVLAFVLQEQAMPACERQKEDAVRRSVAHSKVQEHFRYEDPPTGRGALKRIIQSDSFDPKTGTLVKPRIQEYDEDHRVSKEVAADRAVWNRTTGEWDFYTGEVIYHPRKNKSDFIRGATFEHLRYKAPNPTKLGSATMTLRQHLDHGDFEMVSMSDLVAYREIVRQEARQTHNPDDLKAKQQSIKSVTFGIHDKISTPLICIALVLVGVPLGIRPQRSASSGLAMGLSLIVLLLYYTAYSWTQTVGGAGQGNPALMAYASLVLTVVVGSVLVWWKDH